MREKLLRNYDNILLFTGFTVTLCLLFRTFSVLYDFYHLADKKAEHQYVYRYVGNYLTPDDMDYLENIATENRVTIQVEGCRLKTGDVNVRNSVSICFNLAEGYSEEPNSIVVGKSLRTLVDDNACLLLDNQQFIVSSFIQNDLTDDNSIRVFWGNLSDDHKLLLCSSINERDIGSENCYFYMEGNLPLEDCRDEVIKYFEGDCLAGGDPLRDNYMKSFENGMMMVTLAVMLVFAMICDIMMADLWITRRKREYLICVAMGFDRRQMFFRMLLEMGRTALKAFLLALILEFAAEGLKGFLMQNLNRCLFGMSGLAVGTFAVAGIALYIPYRRIRKFLPTQANIDSMGV